MCWITIKHSKPSELLEDGKKAFAYILECFSRAETNKPVRRYKIQEVEILMEKFSRINNDPIAVVIIATNKITLNIIQSQKYVVNNEIDNFVLFPISKTINHLSNIPLAWNSILYE